MQYGCGMDGVLKGYGRYGTGTVVKRYRIVFEQNDDTA